MARKYELKQRAEKQDVTRQRIVEAVVELHATVGLVRASISAIAEKAGVQRWTVYRHFPDEVSIFRACTMHWMQHNPLPNVASWIAIDDPRERLRAGLHELYAFYDRTEPMLTNVMRDIAQVPAAQEGQQLFLEEFCLLQEALETGWGAVGDRHALVQAALGHAMAFSTWQSLQRAQELNVESAVALMVCLIGCAATDEGQRGCRV